MIVYTAFTFPTSHYFVHLSQGRDLYAFSYGGHGFNANLLYTTKMWWCHDSVLIWTSEEFKRYSGFHFVTLSYLTLTLKRSLKSLSTFFPAEYSLEDSDLEGLSDITVSSVHTSDLSSFEGESEDEQQLSDSSEEGELPPDGLCRQQAFYFWITSPLVGALWKYFKIFFLYVLASFFSQMKVRGKKKNTALETQEMKTKSVNLAARPMFTSPSSTPVTIATQMMRSLWRNVVVLRWAV